MSSYQRPDGLQFRDGRSIAPAAPVFDARNRVDNLATVRANLAGYRERAREIAARGLPDDGHVEGQIRKLADLERVLAARAAGRR